VAPKGKKKKGVLKDGGKGLFRQNKLLPGAPTSKEEKSPQTLTPKAAQKEALRGTVGSTRKKRP